MRPHILMRQRGLTLVEVLVALGVFGLLVAVIIDLIAFVQGPASISTPVEVQRISLPDGGAVIFFDTTVTYGTARTATTTRELEIAEDSGIYQPQIGAVLFTVNIGSTTAATRFTLVCRPRNFFTDLQGNRGSTDLENEFEVFVEYDFITPFFPNVQSDSATVSCGGPGGAPTPGSGGENG